MGDALVTSIVECPAIEPGWGAVVTGTFRHEIGPQGVLRLLVEGASEAVGVTDNHPYWSEDRQDFVPAGELREGELLRTQLGPRRVVSITHDPNHIGFVYNLETTEHVYLVGELGALVHNSCASGDGDAPRGAVDRTNAQLVQSIGTRAEVWGGRRGLSATGSVEGTLKHGYADRLLPRYQRMFGDRGLSTEVRYINGRPSVPGDGLRGSIRLDVVDGPIKNPVAVFDYKFGNAVLSNSRINQIRRIGGFGANVPIIPIHP